MLVERGYVLRGPRSWRSSVRAGQDSPESKVLRCVGLVGQGNQIHADVFQDCRVMLFWKVNKCSGSRVGGRQGSRFCSLASSEMESTSVASAATVPVAVVSAASYSDAIELVA